MRKQVIAVTILALAVLFLTSAFAQAQSDQKGTAGGNEKVVKIETRVEACKPGCSKTEEGCKPGCSKGEIGGCKPGCSRTEMDGGKSGCSKMEMEECERTCSGMKGLNVNMNMAGMPFDMFAEDRGFLGVALDDLTPQLREYFGVPDSLGVLVKAVEKDSPADKAGIKAGDVILEIDGKKIADGPRARRLIGKKEPGDEIGVAVSRKGSRKEFKTKLDKAPEGASCAMPQVKIFKKFIDDGEESNVEIEKYLPPHMMGPGPDFKNELRELRDEINKLKEQIKELKSKS